ncbi:MAG: hypothetical protein R2751_01715 [Bacteroidales bacterium]
MEQFMGKNDQETPRKGAQEGLDKDLHPCYLSLGQLKDDENQEESQQQSVQPYVQDRKEMSFSHGPPDKWHHLREVDLLHKLIGRI